MELVENNILEELPWRQVSRVLIVKDGLICLGNVRDTKGFIHRYQYPGGGRQGNETLEETVVRETLEEVGIRIKNIEPLNFNTRVRYGSKEKSKALKFTGTETYYYVADFDCYDNSILGVAGDVMDYEWLAPFNIYSIIGTRRPSLNNQNKLKALNLVWNIIGSPYPF